MGLDACLRTINFFLQVSGILYSKTQFCFHENQSHKHQPQFILNKIRARQSLFFRRGGSGLPIPTFCASPLLSESLRHNFGHMFFENTILPF